MYLQWKKSGRSECGNYQANKAGAYWIAEFGGGVIAGKAESAAENRAICQRHAWKIAAQQAINEVCIKIGGAELSHALKVDSSQVSRWKLGRALVPARHCYKIGILLGVSCFDLRPDLFIFAEEGVIKWRKRSAVLEGALMPGKWCKRSAVEGGAES